MKLTIAFWECVVKMDGCWLWVGGRDKDGYGRITIDGRIYAAHRLSCESHYGPMETGMVVDHLCRVKNCVNPDHLEAVTRGENRRRGSQIQNHFKLLPSVSILPEEYEAHIKRLAEVSEMPIFVAMEKERLLEIEQNKGVMYRLLAENGGFETSNKESC